MSYKEKFIEFMLDSEVLKFGSFKTKSGRESPYFINTGNYKNGYQIKLLGEYYANCIYDNIKENFTVLYGPAYKGIPLCVTTSIALLEKYNINVNYTFNRKEIKDHGEGGSLVGYIPDDTDKIIIIEDVITAGTSVKETIEILSKISKAKILGVIVSVDRMEKGSSEKSALKELEENFNIKTYSIVNIKEIIDYLYNREINNKIIINDDLYKKIIDYQNRYCIIY